ncbi:MAG: hypothetical protein ACI8PP_000694 [Candidatus Pseudothioglobus sp.]|jgi:uncharacterized protein (DUF924 family)
MNSEAILKFWIGTAALDSEAAKNRSKRWYTSSADDDEAMSVQFGATLKQAERGALADWQKTPQGRLALVILLDQMSRNIYRGTAQAYANDAHALDLASQMVDAGEHLQLTNIEQVFLFHPFEHAESLAAQQRSVQLFTELLSRATADWHQQLQRFLDFAIIHHNIIATYGRFPHRNSVLERQSTAAESDYLIKGPTFGQSHTTSAHNHRQ